MLRKFTICFYAMLVMVLGSSLCVAQIPCYPEYDSRYYTFSLPTQYPPLVTSMPLDVLVGHIGLDSLCKVKTYQEIETFFRTRLTWDDTLRYTARYFLTMIDYNPVLLGLTRGSAAYKSLANVHRDYLVELARGLSAKPKLDEAILGSDYILAVTVTSITDEVDTSAAFAQTVRIVHFTVNDTILGKILPGCYGAGGPGNSIPPDCNWFDVRRENVGRCLEDAGLPSDPTSIAAALPSIGKQYLVFLRLSSLCRTSTMSYMTLMPSYSISAKAGIFEVSSGLIADPANLFGLGSGPGLSAATGAIRSRILTLKTLGN